MDHFDLIILSEMFERKLIQEWIDFPFSLLNSKWNSEILDYLRKQYQGKVHSQHGGIRHIEKVTRIIDSSIPPTLTVVKCFVEFVAETFMPVEEKSYHGIVSRVMEIGLFIEYGATIRILIQKSHLEGYEFKNKEYINQNPPEGLPQSIRDGSIIPYTIIKTHITSHDIKCIAFLGQKKAVRPQTTAEIILED